jgi:hypothetical protein
MFDKYKSCQGCPDHVLGCRTTCEGWAYRESLKPALYAARLAYHNGVRNSLTDRQYASRINNAMASKRRV